jgi:hypothetical protein
VLAGDLRYNGPVNLLDPDTLGQLGARPPFASA